MTTFPKTLIDRFAQFKSGEFKDIAARYEKLANEGQKPEVMVISCCDSRCTPESIFAALPGDLFVVRNVANLVPPFEGGDQINTYHGVSAALEFAVLNLEVSHVVIMGHARCGGVQASLAGGAPVETEAKFISRWIGLLDEPRNRLRTEYPNATNEDLQSKLEYEGVKSSLRNLRSFPFVAEREKNGKLALHGACFDIATGDLEVYDPDSGDFNSL
ncbi:MAG: carbonic anhydrase [Hyphomicrobiaceae bacterium]